MMKRLFRFLSMAMMLALVTACVHTTTTSQMSASPVMDGIAKRGVLVVGTAATMPPLNMTTKNGEIIGLEPDMAKMMADEMGVKIEFKAMPFAELIPALKAGKVDMVISNMTMTGKRNMDVAFVGPYFVSGKSFLTKSAWLATAKDIQMVNSPKTRLAALNGSTSQIFVKEQLPSATLITGKDYGEMVQMVLDGKADAMVADFPICVFSVFRYPGQDLVSLMPPLNYEPIGVAVHKGDPLLVNWVENFLNYLEGSGEMKRLADRWVKDGAWVKRLP
jgi:polar amino acid transport system substrate-binding protein